MGNCIPNNFSKTTTNTKPTNHNIDSHRLDYIKEPCPYKTSGKIHIPNPINLVVSKDS